MAVSGSLAAAVAPRPFSGSRTNRDDPEEYLSDLTEFIDDLYGSADPERTQAKTLYHFRRGLTGEARVWYDRQSRDDRQDWTRLRARFLSAFQVDEVYERLRRQLDEDELQSVQQGPDETVRDYIERIEALYRRVGDDEGVLGRRVVKGLKDPMVAGMVG